jgi:hypothetical protein
MNKLKLIFYAIPLLFLFSLSPKIEASTVTVDNGSLFTAVQNINYYYEITIPNGVTEVYTNQMYTYSEEIDINGSVLRTNGTHKNSIYNTGQGGGIATIQLSAGTVKLRLYNDTRTTNWIPTRSLAQLQTLTVSYDNPTPTTTDINNITWLDDTKVDTVTGDITTNNKYRSTELIDVTTYSNLKINDNYSSDQTWTWLSVYDDNFDYVGVVHPSNAFNNDSKWTNANFIQTTHRTDPNKVLDVTNYGYIRINQYIDTTDTDLWPVINSTWATAYADSISIDVNIGLVTVTFADPPNADIVVTVVEGNSIEGYKSNIETNLDPRQGYEFTGWSPDVSNPTEDVTLTAQWQQLVTYEVTFLDWDNSEIGTVTVEQGETAVPPYIPTRTGYTFDSWLPPVANIQGDITTVAQYTPNTYLVTWTSDDIEIKADQEAYDSNILSHAPEVTKENHNLIGWKIDPTETLVTSGQLVNAPLSLTAVWEAVPTYTVTWRDEYYYILKIEYVAESGIATAPNYIAESGFQLVGWNPDPTQPITENTIFVAQVQPITMEETSGTTIIYRTQLPDDYSGITDLFGGVFGGIVGTIMILGTIDLFGVQLASLLWLFFAGTGFFMMWKLVK